MVTFTRAHFQVWIFHAHLEGAIAPIVLLVLRIVTERVLTAQHGGKLGEYFVEIRQIFRKEYFAPCALAYLLQLLIACYELNSLLF